MLIKLIEYLKKTNNLGMPQKGRVVDNMDPRKLGRVKCIIESLIEETDYEKLPWISCKNPAMLGGRNDSGSFAVPELDSELIIEFPFGDIYAGFYTGYWQSEATHQGIFNEDYPESYGFRDATGNQFRVNKTKKYIEVQHSSGSAIRLDKEGNIILKSKNKINFVTGDDKIALSMDINNGNFSFSPKGGFEILGAKSINKVAECIEDIGNKKQTISGSKECTIVGGNKKIVGGSDSESITGNKGSVIAGNKSSMVAGKVEETIGQGGTLTVALGDLIRKLTKGKYGIEIILGDIELKTMSGNAKIECVLGKVTLKGMKVALNNGTGQVLTTVTMPVVDTISGAPSIGVPTVLAG